MKFVFIIQSHTTFLTSMGVIDYLHLKEEDVIMLYMRHYSNSVINHGFTIVDFNTAYDNYCDTLFNSRKVRKEGVRYIDRLIEQHINDFYHLFAPHYGAPLFQVIYSHPLCVDGAYVQEGGVPFSTAYIRKIPWYRRIRNFAVNRLYYRTKRIWRPSLWYAPYTLTKQKSIDSYSVSLDFFKYLPSTNHIVKWPSVNVDININSKYPIFIADSYLSFGICDEDVYIDSWERLINEYSKDNNYIKFHPQQKQEEIDMYLSFFKGKHVKVLPNDIPFELILLSKTQDKLSVLGLGSSLLFFARDLGHNVICKDKWLLGSHKYKNYKARYGFDLF